MNKKNIILGVSGGIAAYKACELARTLVKNKYTVYTVMTAHAAEFVTPLTFRTLTGKPVFCSLFAENSPEVMPHISLSRECGLMVIAPATASLIAKIAHGLADDLLSTLCLSFTGKIIIAPAMNKEMWENPLFRKNLEILKQFPDKYLFAGPEKGELACGEEGMGRLAGTGLIMTLIENECR